LDKLFALYDEDNDGLIDYNEFTSKVFGHKDSFQQPIKKPEEYINKVQSAVSLFKTKLIAKGIRGLLSLYRLFCLSDELQSGTLNFNDFNKDIRERKIGVNSSDVQEIFNAFDIDRTKRVHYNKLMKTVRGEMNDYRKMLVKRAFDRLDLSESEIVEIKDIKAMYNPLKHPAVIEGRKTEDEVLQEFLETFELHHEIYGSKGVSEEEFVEYYNYVSATVESDEYFENIVSSVWNLESFNKKSSVSLRDVVREEIKSTYKEVTDQPSPSTRTKLRTEYDKPTEPKEIRFGNIECISLTKSQSIMLNRFRTKLLARGAKGIFGIEKQLRLADIDESGRLTKEELSDAIRDYQIKLDERDFNNLFKIFREENDIINYRRFMQIVVGKMNNIRRHTVERAFEYLDTENEGAIDMKTLRDNYNGKMDPDIKLGKKTEDEAVNEFILSFDIHHKEYESDLVTKKEFVDYYTKVSAAISSDSQFNALVGNVWSIGRGDVNRLPYAGVSSKVYSVDTKSIWSYDHHRTILNEDEAKSKGPKSIYEMSEIGRSVALPSHSMSKRSQLEETKGRE
jgi:Ca2+-binding EF-hand superfamily protein